MPRKNRRKNKKITTIEKNTIEKSIEKTNFNVIELSQKAIELANKAENADKATDCVCIAIENISELDIKKELTIIKDDIRILNQYNQEAIEKTKQLAELLCADPQSHYCAVLAVEASKAHKDAESFAMEYAKVANILVEKYRLAKTAALELISAAITASNSHSIAAEAFETVAKKIEENAFFSEKKDIQ